MLAPKFHLGVRLQDKNAVISTVLAAIDALKDKAQILVSHTKVGPPRRRHGQNDEEYEFSERLAVVKATGAIAIGGWTEYAVTEYQTKLVRGLDVLLQDKDLDLCLCEAIKEMRVNSSLRMFDMGVAEYMPYA
ncbi:hypothetical protein OIV83_002915 [Microbotryomycetes sp. JL201]|nr:hypothetical protein OIV83_002915 [Microbotryomycetes sp. JL201]